MVDRQEAEHALREASRDAAAQFRDGQWEAIKAVAMRQRVLLVQRTGWGKSMVYFVATRLLRRAGAGPTLIISPLLALMRDQLRAAAGLGLTAETINSSNRDDWDAINARVRRDEVDLLLVSPERLANAGFVERCLLPVAGRIACLVVDEAHCISDWGHDFRPDYQRIGRLLRALPPNVAVLATTATANRRVVDDVIGQLGAGTLVQRGPLARASLRLENIRLPSQAARLGWLAEHVPRLPGSGIVYALTVRDVERVAAWLRANGISAHAYHGDVDPVRRVELEEALQTSQCKVLVATSALGMGYDKPDLGFVIHFQAPQSVVHYYQQVGRAGRAVPEAFAVLLAGEEDDAINSYFIAQAFPPEADVEAVLAALTRAEDGLSIAALLREVNLSKGRAEKVVKLLAVADNAPIAHEERRWLRTANPFRLDRERIARLSGKRREEWQQIQDYIASPTCLMEFLERVLDDPFAARCGRCAVCTGRPVIGAAVGRRTLAEAESYARQGEVVLTPRKQWPTCALPRYGWSGNIPAARRNEEGRALSVWGEAGWARLVAEGKASGRFPDDLVRACAAMIEGRWQPFPTPAWLTYVPSCRSGDLVPDFGRRLAAALGVPFRAAVAKVRDTPRQRDMANSWHQAHNLDGAFAVAKAKLLPGAVLLLDDIVDSGWSLTVTGALLHQAGSGRVFPLALCQAKGA